MRRFCEQRCVEVLRVSMTAAALSDVVVFVYTCECRGGVRGTRVL